MKIEKQKLLALFEEGHSVQFASSYFCCNRSNLYDFMARHKIPLPGPVGNSRIAKKLSLDQLMPMVRAGRTAPEIADHFECTRQAVYDFCNRWQIPLTKKPPKKRGPKSKSVKSNTTIAPPKATRHASTQKQKVDPVKAALIETGGRYAELAKWAKRQNISLQRAQLEWHKLRLPLNLGDQS